MGSESQSRYAIVLNLTTAKILVLEERHNIESDVSKKNADIVKLSSQRRNKKLELEAQTAAELGMFDSEIDKLKSDIEVVTNTKQSKIKLCDEKIRQIDQALQAIQDISKSSAEEASR